MSEDKTPYEHERTRYRLDQFARSKWETTARSSDTARVIYNRSDVPEDWQLYIGQATTDEARRILTSSRELAGIMCALLPHTTENNSISAEQASIYTEPLTPQGRPVGGCRWAGNSVLRIVRDLDR